MCGSARASSRCGTRQGATAARFAVFCAGAWSDVLAERAGAPRDPRIVPFLGRYLYLRPESARLVRSLIYPVPDPSLPFLGVHLTRHVDGRVSLGPTALLQPRLRSLTWPGTWRMASALVAHRDRRAETRTQQQDARVGGRALRARAHAWRLRRRLRRGARAGARPRRQPRGRLRDLAYRARTPRTECPLARGHVVAGDRPADRRPQPRRRSLSRSAPSGRGSCRPCGGGPRRAGPRPRSPSAPGRATRRGNASADRPGARCPTRPRPRSP